jgi:hypothetical protein
LEDAATLTVGMERCGIAAQSPWIVDGNNVTSNGYVDLINAGYATYAVYLSPDGSGEELLGPFAEQYALTVNSSDDVVLAPLSEIGGVVSPTQTWSDLAAVAASPLQAKSGKSK